MNVSLHFSNTAVNKDRVESASIINKGNVVKQLFLQGYMLEKITIRFFLIGS